MSSALKALPFTLILMMTSSAGISSDDDGVVMFTTVKVQLTGYTRENFSRGGFVRQRKRWLAESQARIALERCLLPGRYVPG